MDATLTSGWHDLLIATAGASGALAGLVFVALSINLARILANPELPGRAGETLLLLAGALIVSIIMLIPDASDQTLGWLVFGVGVFMWGPALRMQILSFTRKTYYARSFAFRRLVTHQIATLPMLVAGVALACKSSAGMDWLVVALIASMVTALQNAWVLLVEIVR